VKQRGGKLNRIFAVEGDQDPDTCSSNEFEMVWHGRTQRFPEMDRYGWYDLSAARVKIFSSQAPFLDALEASLDGRSAR
jgi:predicted NUDIX family NTP pyrophosphohydrolase